MMHNFGLILTHNGFAVLFKISSVMHYVIPLKDVLLWVYFVLHHVHNIFALAFGTQGLELQKNNASNCSKNLNAVDIHHHGGSKV